MTHNRPNPAALPLEHPFQVILRWASLGNQPTKAQLQAALNRDDVPEGVDLRRFHARLAAACSKLATTYAPTPNRRNFNDARRLADDYAARFGAEMTDAEAAVEGLGGESETCRTSPPACSRERPMNATGPGVKVNPAERACRPARERCGRGSSHAPMTSQRPAPNGTRHG
ncbi:hypothetical protein [Aquihabitans sp. McL0605]|uniref:hypothetical protein n=1 Tax=Aquihabitans sp. McL0605 TaxID=3415671 RepID=UPI003CEF6E0F